MLTKEEIIRNVEQHRARIKSFGVTKLTLFGSYARGEDVEESDIDLYLEAQNTKPIQLDKYEKILGHKIQVFMHKNIRDIKNKDLANNIINGITLNGFLEVFT